MPQGSALAFVTTPAHRIPQIAIRKLFIICLRKFDFEFDKRFIILISIADPNRIQPLPDTVALDREPRSGHKVDSFESYSCPQMVQSDAFDRAAGFHRLQPVAIDLEFVPDV